MRRFAQQPADLRECYADADARSLLRVMIRDEFPGRIALVSSFGAEAAVLLHMVAEIEADLPVLFLDTGRMFAETRSYQRRLTADLGLTNVRIVRPDDALVEEEDPGGALWRTDPDRCCRLRKVLPLERALRDYDAWITGLKRYHNFVRSDIEPVQYVDGRFKINPLATWDADRVDLEFARHGLRRHPLVCRGYPSIGCAPCTSPVAKGEDQRAGRWRGREKTECGIHRPLFGKND